jgi:predicted nucleic acid-binding protein
VGSERAAELWSAGEPVASSILAYPEGRAALAAAERSDRLGEDAFARALAEFEEIQGELALIGIDEALARQAGELAEGLQLRGYDAVHLASALALQSDEVALVTWDADLHAAAEEVGLGVVDG